MPPEVASADAAMRPSRRGLKIFGVCAVCVAIVVVAYGLITRSEENRQLVHWTDEQAIPTVEVFRPEAVTGNRVLVLPGKLESFYNAPIYSRVPGYLKRWYVDIGAQVKAGQILADIDTPELDQELLQARANLASAEAARDLAAITAKRWLSLLAKDAVSHQESDEKAGDLADKSALVKAAQANVSRLEALSTFKRITAPFDGVVTARKTDIGDLINAGAGANTNSELFDVSEVDKLRLYVRVPQSYSAEIVPGVKAVLTVPEYPNRKVPAKLLNTSNSVSDSSGTLLVQLEVNNTEGMLQTGDYAQVNFVLPATSEQNSFRLPASAVLFRHDGTEVGVVAPDNHVVLKPITIGTDYGQTVEVVSGLAAGDQIIDNPTDSLATGDRVEIAGASLASEADDAHK
jgi:RND family efflux transporter MFP subunit